MTLALVIIIALVFDFTNGFHDTANSIATLVGTRAMAPQTAVAYAATLNFAGAFAGAAVAATIGKGILLLTTAPAQDTLKVLLAALVGAIAWNLATWFFGIPSSSSHALIGGLIGAGLAYGGTGIVKWDGIVQKVVTPSVLAPVLGLVVSLAVMAILMRVFHAMRPGPANRGFRLAQIVSGGWLSFNHGRNDAQKAIGIMGAALGASNGTGFSVPTWIVFSAATAMALGTYAGGWRIIKTLGSKMVKMSPLQGFAASVSAAAILQVTANIGVPVSTTHCVTGCVMGAGASKRISSVRWGVVGEIVTAWILTLPCAALVGALAYTLVAISPAVLMLALACGVVAMRIQAQRSPVAAH